MTEKADRIGVVRQHRWMADEMQVDVLLSRCRIIVSLGGSAARLVDREELVKLITPGTELWMVHAFLLADPKRKRTLGGMKADFRAALSRIEKRGGVVIDVDGGICSEKHKRALLALVDSDLARSNQGAKSATNGARSRGRPKYEPTKGELQAAKAIWRDLIEYPEWDDADKALRKEVNDQFTAARAYKLWRGRKPTTR